MKSFPTAWLLPKEETLATPFLEQYPDYDGRNTVVAIFDTGVDPGASGLQTTPDGRPKILDIVDATGAGDVDTSTVIEAKDGCLTLASGRVLTLNPAWTPSADGTYHVGTVAGYHLFPTSLTTRLKTERKEAFEIHQRRAVNQVQADLVEWGCQNGTTCTDPVNVKEKKELETRLEQLNELARAYEDHGPIYDAIVYHDGLAWRAALDTTESGTFTNIPTLTNYRLERQYATFSDKSQLNYVLNIYDNGNTLSIVNDVGAHGTHVAGIVAAYDPEQPACHGVAPGAQIVAVKIGDGRLDGMETTAAISRAIAAVIKAKVDIVNMSYGEYASQHNYGRVIELSNELVNDHNVTFVVSAGNNGPALGTVGAPGGTTSSLLSVGAYVSPQMMEGEYIMRDNNLSGIAYTWSSRGPTFDGDVGVNVCAPGAAIAPVPKWTLTKKQLMNGTSMSSPNCAGNVALLISAMKALGLDYTPYSIRRALENTAKTIPHVDVYAQGKGLIQLVPAFEYMRYTYPVDGPLKCPLQYHIQTSSGPGNARGIFLRDRIDFEHESTEVDVTVTPVFHKHTLQADKCTYEQHVRLVPSVRWVHVGHNMALLHTGRSFKVLVDTKHLATGDHHYGEIVAYDTQHEKRGALFTIPVSVTKPESATSVVQWHHHLQPGRLVRHFCTPPVGTTWADVFLSRANDTNVNAHASRTLFMFDALQFQPHVRQSQSSYHKTFTLDPGQELAFSLDVQGGLTTEFCFSQFWSALGDSMVHLEIQFHGIVPNQEQIVMLGGEGAHKVLVSSRVQTEVVAPHVAFTKYVQHLRPTTAEISPLSTSRDQFPDQRQVYQLVLTYPFVKKEPGIVVPRLPLLHGRLYESPFEAQLMMIFDDKKQYKGCSDAYGTATTLSKGAYSIRAQVRHEDVQKLEKLKHMILFLSHDTKELTASVYTHPDDVALGRKPMEKTTLRLEKAVPLYIGEPAIENLPAGHAVGEVLTGTISFGPKTGTMKGSGRRPHGFAITYVMPPAPVSDKEIEPDVPDERDEAVVAQEAVRDLLLDRVTKLAGKATFLPAWQRLDEQFPACLPILQAKLHHFDTDALRSSHLAQVLEAADAVLALVAPDALAQFFGTRRGVDESTTEKQVRKAKEKDKALWCDALARKARALGDLGQWDAFQATYATLAKWDEVDAAAYVHVALLHAGHEKAWGRALQRLRKVQAMDAADRKKVIADETLVSETKRVLEALGWAHWVAYETQWERRRAPPLYRRF